MSSRTTQVNTRLQTTALFKIINFGNISAIDIDCTLHSPFRNVVINQLVQADDVHFMLTKINSQYSIIAYLCFFTRSQLTFNVSYFTELLVKYFTEISNIINLPLTYEM